MGPSRRDLLRAVGIATTGGLAGCVGGPLLGGGPEPPGYLDWLSRPGRLVAPGEYRVGIIRPAATPNARSRLAPFLPEVQVQSIDPAKSERLIVSQSVSVLTTTVERATVVNAYEEAGYRYERGIGEFWILDDGEPDTPVIAAGPETVLVARRTARQSAMGVVETLLHAYDSEDHWTRNDPGLQSFTESLGSPSALVLSLASWEETVPRRGHFADARASAISHDFAEPERTYALLFADPSAVPTQAISTWVNAAVTDLENPDVSIEGSVARVTGRPVDTERVRTDFPAADRRWSGLGADARRTSSLADADPPQDPVREQWFFLPEGGVRPPETTEGAVPRGSPLIKVGNLPFNPPAVGDGTVFVTGEDCYALDTRDGQLRWRAGLKQAGGTPVLGERMVYCTAEIAGSPAVVALDMESGSTRWTWQPPSGAISTLVQTSDSLLIGTSPPPLPAEGGTGAESTSGPYGVFAVKTGTEVWRRTGSRVDSMGVIGETVVTAGGRTGATVIGLDLSDGTQRWRRELDAPGFPTVALGAETAVVSGRDAIIGLSLADGTTGWRVTPNRTMAFTRAAIVDEMAYVGSARPIPKIREKENGGTIRAFNLSDGTERFRVGQTRRVTARPAIGGEGVFVVSGGGALARFDRDLTRTWSLYMTGRLGTPAVSGGSIYIPTALGPLAALGTDWLPSPEFNLIATRRNEGTTRI